MALGACGSKQESAQAPPVEPTPAAMLTQEPKGAQAEYYADIQPFSPTLAHLLDQGQLFVIFQSPPEPPVDTPAQGYAFSAVDRYGRLYHFDSAGAWWMDTGWPLTQPLPAGQWDAAWNPQAQELEVLITGPWNGRRQMQRWRWRQGGWREDEVPDAPAARKGARRTFYSPLAQWFVCGGQALTPLSQTQDQPSTATADVAPLAFEDRVCTQGLVLEQQGWAGWPVPAVTGQAAPAPGDVQWMMDCSEEGGLGAVTSGGEWWSWRPQGGWQLMATLPDLQHLWMAHYLPSRHQVLFVWNGGLGKDQFALAAAAPAEPVVKKKIETLQSQLLEETSTIRVNEDEDGLWADWGTVPAGVEEVDKFTSGFEGLAAGDTRQAAIRIKGEYSDAIVSAGSVQLLELPPRLSQFLPSTAVWVPALEALVVGSSEGVGLDVRHEAFFPMPAGEETRLDVYRRSARFALFKGEELTWFDPPYDLHPDLGEPFMMQLPDGTRRSMSWLKPQPGLIQYRYFEWAQQKKQWFCSPLIQIPAPASDTVTTATAPTTGTTASTVWTLCDPVVVGAAPEVMMVGWRGQLKEVEGFSTQDGPQAEQAPVYEQVPGQGYMCRIGALVPRVWRLDEIPIPYCTGAHLVVDATGETVHLIGGRMAQKIATVPADRWAMVPNTRVWSWDGTQWLAWEQEIPLFGHETIDEVMIEPDSNRLVCLTRKAVYWREGESWRREQRPFADTQGAQPALFAHTALGRCALVVAEGKGSTPGRMYLWKARQWGEVLGGETALHILKNYDLVASNAADAFVMLDRQHLAWMRLDHERNRSEDRLMRAWWLRFLPVPRVQPRPHIPLGDARFQ